MINSKMLSLIRHKNEFLVSEHLIPTRRHQIQEELLEKEKDLASLIYMQRDREGRNT